MIFVVGRLIYSKGFPIYTYMKLTHSLLLSVYGIPIHHQLRITMRNAWTHRILLFDQIVAKEPKWKKSDCSVFNFAACLRNFVHMKREFYQVRPEKFSHVSHKKRRRRKKHTNDQQTNTHTQYKCVRMYTHFENRVLFALSLVQNIDLLASVCL